MQNAGTLWSTFLPYIIILAVFYFILIVPQRRRQKQMSDMLASLKEGDNIITYGGIIGKITSIVNDELSIESGLERTKIKIAKWAVKEVQRQEEQK